MVKHIMCSMAVEPGNIKLLRVCLKLFQLCLADSGLEMSSTHFIAQAQILSPFSASAQQMCALAYSSGLLQRYRTAVCSQTAGLLALSLCGIVPLSCAFEVCGIFYVSVCMGSRVCARLQSQLSFKKNSKMVLISFRVLQKFKHLLRRRSQGKISSSGRFEPHFFCILLAWIRTESIFPFCLLGL